MSAPETVIVTVVCPDENIELDMEISANVNVSELRIKILEIMKNVYEEEFTGWTQCNIANAYRVFGDSETLAQAGVFDGSYIYILKQ